MVGAAGPQLGSRPSERFLVHRRGSDRANTAPDPALSSTPRNIACVGVCARGLSRVCCRILPPTLALTRTERQIASVATVPSELLPSSTAVRRQHGPASPTLLCLLVHGLAGTECIVHSVLAEQLRDANLPPSAFPLMVGACRMGWRIRFLLVCFFRSPFSFASFQFCAYEYVYFPALRTFLSY